MSNLHDDLCEGCKYNDRPISDPVCITCMSHDNEPVVVYDNAKNPKHYQLFPDMEVIDVLKKVLTLEEFIGFCKGNVIKYKLRAGEKDDTQTDLNKAKEYQQMLYGKLK